MMPSDYQIVIDHEAKVEEVQMVQAGVVEYNTPFLGPKEKFCVFLKDGEGGILGGATGHVYRKHNFLFVDFVHIDKNLRRSGYGRSLMQEVENEARRLGCKVIVLDTFSFQAEGFYAKLGFKRLGVIEKHTSDYDRIYLRKVLE